MSFSDHGWTTNGPNILAKERLELIRQALSMDWVGGAHFYYCAGRGGESIAFNTYDAFLSQVTESRPGDLFVLWSIAELRRKGLLLADRRFVNGAATGESLLTSADFDRVDQYLAEQKFNEVLCISSDGVGGLKTIWSDADDSLQDRLLDTARRAAVPGGVIIIFPFTQLDKAEDYLTKAKRPNEKGEVPLGGAY